MLFRSKAGQLGAELRIGSFNMLRFCDTVANTTFACGNGGEPNQAAFDLKVARLSDYVVNVLKLPDVLGVVEVGIGVWTLSGIAPVLCALSQTLLLVTLNANGLLWARHIIHDPGGMVVKNFALLLLAWAAALQ